MKIIRVKTRFLISPKQYDHDDFPAIPLKFEFK